MFSGSQGLAEYDNGAAVASPTREYVYSGGRRLAKIESGGTSYYHFDHLSVRLTTDANQNYVAHMGQYPYGEMWYDDLTHIKDKFTTYERDSESGNDYAIARSYVNRLARFSSPDPLSGGLDDPQSLNRYTYALNDPCSHIDPLGLASCTFNVHLLNHAGLNQQQLDKIVKRMNDLLGATKSPEGDTVQISTNFRAEFSDVSIRLSNANWFDNNIYPNIGNLGLTFGTHDVWNGTRVYVNNIGQMVTEQLVNATGSVAAHEFGHNFLGRDQDYNKDNPNIMMFDDAPGSVQTPALSNPNDSIWKFTPEQIKKLYNDCLKMHPPAPSNPKGQSSGSRGGGGGGGGNGGPNGGSGNGPSDDPSGLPDQGGGIGIVCVYIGGYPAGCELRHLL